MTKFKTNKKKAKAFKGAVVLIIAAILVMVITACPNRASSSGGGGTPPATSETEYKFVDIQGVTIKGAFPGCTLPESEDWWKGVFINGRTVKLSPYKLGKTEVTYDLWYKVRTWAESKGYTFANKGLEGWDGTGGGGSHPNYTNIGNPPTGNKNHPVAMVSWRDCIVWCNAYTEMKLGSDEQCVYRKSDSDTTVLKDAKAKEGEVFICDKAYADMNKKGFRLPTEAEWEYAVRWQGSDKTNAGKYGDVYLTKLNSASGAKADWNDAAETGEVAWYSGNSGGKTHPVGKRRENALGLHDMSGNVWEWCFDWHDTIAAENVTDPQGAAVGIYRVKRGGSWLHDAKYCTVGGRNSINTDYSYIDIGFRLACRH
ncbi:formylglycine-generating enzyme family protein [Treponema putidum]|uniref:Formylglycine-generating enzyme family protein n=1 Tax=Treponema putidum TaxID=221027 RepID=A0AAE9MQS9_9SPIR|nr:SUMF1/EgtB/PvdO family nonheme iron enzyme [Treponema putidum]UTY32744.1 formylglycine-generating enzyme family protein [Treponema putidum]